MDARVAWGALAVGCGAPVYLPKEPPPPVDRVDETGQPASELPCSGAGAVAVTLRVDNRLAAAADVFWVDGGCAEVWYGTVPGNAVLDLSSYDTHVWLARDLVTSTALGSVVLSAEATQSLVLE